MAKQPFIQNHIFVYIWNEIIFILSFNFWESKHKHIRKALKGMFGCSDGNTLWFERCGKLIIQEIKYYFIMENKKKNRFFFPRTYATI